MMKHAKCGHCEASLNNIHIEKIPVKEPFATKSTFNALVLSCPHCKAVITAQVPHVVDKTIT